MNDKVNIVLIGMPGCGKSTLGKALAKRLGRDFYDADDVIVEQEGKTIPELFAVSEDCFRDAEVRASRTLAAKQGVIIACGGGVIKRPENMAILKKTGKVFFIDRSPDDIVSDVDVAVRPLLKEAGRKSTGSTKNASHFTVKRLIIALSMIKAWKKYSMPLKHLSEIYEGLSEGPAGFVAMS